MKNKRNFLYVFITISVIFSSYAAPNKKITVQVVNQKNVNLDTAETLWLPEKIRDKLTSNLQEYLEFTTIADNESELAVKKLQAESENAGRDEATAIEFGKILTAKYAVFTKIIKSPKGYSINADFVNLTTGVSEASAISSEYENTELMCADTGAIDEITVALADKLAKKFGTVLSNLNRKQLTSGSSGFNIDEQLALAKQNEANYQKKIKNFDIELSKLNKENDISSLENKNRIEAEKALLAQKLEAVKNRQEELNAQKLRASEDLKQEAARSIALKNMRDEMQKDIETKVASLRKIKTEKQGVLGEISLIEAKKKALVETRKSVERRCLELYYQLNTDIDNEENRILTKKYTTAEVDGKGNLTVAARLRRITLLENSNKDLHQKFFDECESIKSSIKNQDEALYSEILSDERNLAKKIRTVSSLGSEFEINFGNYEGEKSGWNANLVLYSEGQLIYKDNFIVGYEALSGKKAPDLRIERDDNIIDEYANNVEMFNSLLAQGTPLVYFEIDYTVSPDLDKLSSYTFTFNKIRVVNILSNKITQTINLDVKKKYVSTPGWDLQVKKGILEEEKERFFNDSNLQLLPFIKEFLKKDAELFVEINEPEKKVNVKTMKTEMPQKLYTTVMGENPSFFKGDDLPVESISKYDAIYFCNKLSSLARFTPVYSVNGTTDVTKWNYTPHKNQNLSGIKYDKNADGYRLLTKDEWKIVCGKELFHVCQSFVRKKNELENYAWYNIKTTKTVGTKKPNEFNLYDTAGNVSEWCWEHNCGTSFSSHWYMYKGYYNFTGDWIFPDKISSRNSSKDVGFRIAQNINKGKKNE